MADPHPEKAQRVEAHVRELAAQQRRIEQRIRVLQGLLDGTIRKQQALAAERVLVGQERLREMPFRVLSRFITKN
jgi:hypothetical protein